tara:strand:+ start:55 stop:483 length:429 start_codon:yes stop_codon:yes gene_type:complete
MKKQLSVTEKELRKNRKSQRFLSLKDDPESQKRLENLQKEELEILQKMACDKERKENRLKKAKEKKRLENMSFDQTCEYFKKKDNTTILSQDNIIPNDRETRIHRRRIIQGIREYKENQCFQEKLEMRLKLKEFIEGIESKD